MTTHWSVVQAAADGTDAHARACLEMLCQTYWKPLYRFARRQGQSSQDAEDLVQGFFAMLLERGSFPEVDRERGRFRTYLLGALKKHMASEWRRAHRLKRGGYEVHFSLDWESAETGLSLKVKDERSPDRLFDKDWAEVVLAHVLQTIEEEFREEGKESQFKAMKVYLVMSSERIAYTALADQLGISGGAAKVAVHRLRKRYRETLRRYVAETLSSEEQVEDEMKSLFMALSE